jgi:peptidoglycan hydrolase-like protein with peptidoglycan-binding domain
VKRAPYPGQLKLGSTGEPVVLMKRALRLAGLLPGKGKPTGFLGPIARRALVKLQQADHLPALEKPGKVKAGRRPVKKIPTSGIYGPATHVKLANYYDDFGASRLRAIARSRQVASVQAAGVAAMNLVITNRGSIHYTQGARRMSGVRNGYLPPRFGSWEDCSSEATWIAFVMDAAAKKFGGRFPDPNGLGYNGQGYTGTQVNHGVPVTAMAGPIARTFVFYGHGLSISHVAVKKRMDRVMSMGSERGPLDESVVYRTPVTARAYPVVLPP